MNSFALRGACRLCVHVHGSGNVRVPQQFFPDSHVGTRVVQSSPRHPARRSLYSALWQADGKKIRRFAPVDFIGRCNDGFFDYAIADEVHELKGGDTAQGNALWILAASARHIAVPTTQVAPEEREAWYERQLRSGVQV